MKKKISAIRTAGTAKDQRRKDTLKRPGSDITVLYCGIRLLFYFRKSEKKFDVTIDITSKRCYINQRKM